MAEKKRNHIPFRLLFLLLLSLFIVCFCTSELNRLISESNSSARESEKIEKPQPVPENHLSDTTLKIASFNIRIFSDNSRNDEELTYITDILSKYDIIAIQELRDEEVMKRAVTMLEEMGFEYDYEISENVGRGIKERYAFLYRNDKVEKLLDGMLYPDEDDKFIREPFYATFRSGNFNFTLATIHLIYGSNKAERRLGG